MSETTLAAPDSSSPTFGGAPVLAAFQSHYSLQGSLLTLDEPGKAKPGAPVSVFDLAKQGGLKEVLLIEDRIDGFIEAYKSAIKAKVALCYGLRFTVCSSMADKTPASEATESRVIVFLVGGKQAYHDVIRLWNRAWTEGHYTTRDGSYGRLDWATLRAFWTPNLMLGLSFFSSFVARNLLSISRIVPDLPHRAAGCIHPLVVCREVDSGLPFAPLIDSALDTFTKDRHDVEEVRTKTVYYADGKRDFKAYVVKRCISARSSFDAPDIDHLSSDAFGFDSFLGLSTPPASAGSLVAA